MIDLIVAGGTVDAFGPELSQLLTGLTVGVLWSFRYRVKMAGG